jgi:hypothetical protein
MLQVEEVRFIYSDFVQFIRLLQNNYEVSRVESLAHLDDIRRLTLFAIKAIIILVSSRDDKRVCQVFNNVTVRLELLLNSLHFLVKCKVVIL